MIRTIVRNTGTLHLGRQGENLARALLFPEVADWRAALGEGEAQLLYLPPGGEAAFPAALVEEDGAAVWPIAAAQTALAGYGRCELRWRTGKKVVKSRAYLTFVAPTLPSGSQAPPPGGESHDHRTLDHRDAADQHPMAAITGLAETVKRIPRPVEPLTNLELEELLK